MILIIALLSSVLAVARADCDACVNGTCHSRKTLFQGFNISGTMAIDQFSNILYVQLNLNMTMALYLDEMLIRLVLMKKTSGMTVDQDTGTLYMDDPDKNTTYANGTEKDVELMFYQNYLYYTKKNCKGISFRYNGLTSLGHYSSLNNYSITEFVVDKYKNLFFIADDIVYKLKLEELNQYPEILFEAYYSLSLDKYGELYLGDPSSNFIFKFDYTTNELTTYAAYNTDTIDKFVFDSSNNMIFHNTVDGNVYKWQLEHTECTFKTNCVNNVIETVPQQLRNGTEL